MKENEKKGVRVKVDNKEIPLNPFVENFLINTIKGMLSTLKGFEAKKKIVITIEED